MNPQTEAFAVNTTLQRDAVTGEANLSRRKKKKARNRQAIPSLSACVNGSVLQTQLCCRSYFAAVAAAGL